MGFCFFGGRCWTKTVGGVDPCATPERGSAKQPASLPSLRGERRRRAEETRVSSPLHKSPVYLSACISSGPVLLALFAPEPTFNDCRSSRPVGIADRSAAHYENRPASTGKCEDCLQKNYSVLYSTYNATIFHVRSRGITFLPALSIRTKKTGRKETGKTIQCREMSRNIDRQNQTARVGKQKRVSLSRLA